MTTDTFQLAVRRARRNYTDVEWHSLTFSDQARAIYIELARLDAAAVAANERKPGMPAEGSVKIDPDLLW